MRGIWARSNEMKNITVFLLIAVWALPGFARVTVDVESGMVFSGYNDVRIPGEGGTFFSLVDDFESDDAAFWRFQLEYRLAPRHILGVLAAPLSIDANGISDKEIIYDDVTFPAGSDIDAVYRFDSYRLRYRYQLVQNRNWEFLIGLTAKIREAEISLESGNLRASYDNTGFVPLLNARIHWFPSYHFGVLLDADALAAPQGRAEDVLLALTYHPYPIFELRAGYRILEGGADNDKVYTFALFHYAVLGATIRF